MDKSDEPAGHRADGGRSSAHLFIIGAQRSGTTSLYHALDGHPDVSMAKPVSPEPKFFLDPSSTAAGWKQRYQQLFSLGGSTTVLGEKSTTYIERLDAAERIATVLPAARIVAVLRDPVERAVSNYRFSVANGFEDRPIEEALDPAMPPPPSPAGLSTSPYAYLRRGRYDELLPGWIDLFASNLLLVDFADVTGNGGGVESVLEFLGLQPRPTSAPMGKTNSSPGPVVDLTPALRASLEQFYEPTMSWIRSTLPSPSPSAATPDRKVSLEQ